MEGIETFSGMSDTVVQCSDSSDNIGNPRLTSPKDEFMVEKLESVNENTDDVIPEIAEAGHIENGQCMGSARSSNEEHVDQDQFHENRASIPTSNEVIFNEEEEVYETTENITDKVGRWTFSTGAARKSKSKSKLISTTSAKDYNAEKLAVHSASQRLIREAEVLLPCYKPKQYSSFTEFRKALRGEKSFPASVKKILTTDENEELVAKDVCHADSQVESNAVAIGTAANSRPDSVSCSSEELSNPRSFKLPDKLPEIRLLKAQDDDLIDLLDDGNPVIPAGIHRVNRLLARLNHNAPQTKNGIGNANPAGPVKYSIVKKVTDEVTKSQSLQMESVTYEPRVENVVTFTDRRMWNKHRAELQEVMRAKRLRLYEERMQNYEPPEPLAKKRNHDSDEEDWSGGDESVDTDTLTETETEEEEEENEEGDDLPNVSHVRKKLHPLIDDEAMEDSSEDSPRNPARIRVTSPPCTTFEDDEEEFTDLPGGIKATGSGSCKSDGIADISRYPRHRACVEPCDVDLFASDTTLPSDKTLNASKTSARYEPPSFVSSEPSWIATPYSLFFSQKPAPPMESIADDPTLEDTTKLADSTVSFERSSVLPSQTQLLGSTQPISDEETETQNVDMSAIPENDFVGEVVKPRLLRVRQFIPKEHNSCETVCQSQTQLLPEQALSLSPNEGSHCDKPLKPKLFRACKPFTNDRDRIPMESPPRYDGNASPADAPTNSKARAPKPLLVRNRDRLADKTDKTQLMGNETVGTDKSLLDARSSSHDFTQGTADLSCFSLFSTWGSGPSQPNNAETADTVVTQPPEASTSPSSTLVLDDQPPEATDGSQPAHDTDPLGSEVSISRKKDEAPFQSEHCGKRHRRLRHDSSDNSDLEAKSEACAEMTGSVDECENRVVKQKVSKPKSDLPTDPLDFLSMADVDDVDDDDEEASMDDKVDEVEEEEEDVDGSSGSLTSDLEEEYLNLGRKTPRDKRNPRFQPEEFIDAEAELSGDEVERANYADEQEDEDDSDAVSLKEFVDETEMDDRSGKLRREVERVYNRIQADEDQRKLRYLKEMFFEDGDLYDEDGKVRQRRFRWRGLENDDPFSTNDVDLDEDNDAEEDGDASTSGWLSGGAGVMSRWLLQRSAGSLAENDTSPTGGLGGGSTTTVLTPGGMPSNDESDLGFEAISSKLTGSNVFKESWQQPLAPLRKASSGKISKSSSRSDSLPNPSQTIAKSPASSSFQAPPSSLPKRGSMLHRSSSLFSTSSAISAVVPRLSSLIHSDKVKASSDQCNDKDKDRPNTCVLGLRNKVGLSCFSVKSDNEASIVASKKTHFSKSATPQPTKKSLVPEKRSTTSLSGETKSEFKSVFNALI
uniref:Claspin n=1 Tax=Mesocestoides corti TaxID=53468 RepID=A0A5K3EG64_MESCO